MFKSLFLPLIGVALFITFVGLLSQGKLSFLTPNSSPLPSNTKTIKIDDIEIIVEVSKTNEERAKGRSNRNSLKENSGMIFIFEKNSRPTFWMKDTKIALDFIWISNDKVVGVNKNVQPEPNLDENNLTKYPAPTGIDYVLQVNGGFSDKNKIKVGSNVQKLSDL